MCVKSDKILLSICMPEWMDTNKSQNHLNFTIFRKVINVKIGGNNQKRNEKFDNSNFSFNSIQIFVVEKNAPKLFYLQ